MAETLTQSQKELVMEALVYYRDNASQPNTEICGLNKRKARVMNQAIDKIQKNW